MPHALIVDDSKTARYALRQMLDKHQFSVDMLESAEQALEYLHHESPDVIFMDHMMPGMDGFQAVKAIKSNPATAAIPIVMYTSTQGGMYFGQARALGAADVIAKPATPEDLSAVLQRLEEHHLLGPRAGRPAPAPEGGDEPPLAAALTGETDEPYAQSHAPLTPPAETFAAPDRAQPAPRRSFWLPVLLALALLATTALYYTTALQRDRLARQQQTAFKAIEWGVNLAQEYPYGELPFGGARLQRLQDLVGLLNASGFRGTVRLESHTGEFCLLHTPPGRGQRAAWVVAPPELSLTDCSALGQNAEQAQRQSEGQSLAFRRYLQALPQIMPGIRVQLVALGASQPLVDYPTDVSVSAGEWNEVAQHNQRVHVVLQPESQVGRGGGR